MSQFQTWYRTLPTALRHLIVINVVLYLAWLLLFGRIGVTAQFGLNWLALNPELPGILLQPWQLLTYNFLHLNLGLWGLIHILFNMLWLYWIGREYEEMHGPHQLLAIYVLAGVGGGIASVLFYSIIGVNVVVYGASASVLGLITAVAILYPYKKVNLIFLGTVKLLWLVIGFLVIDILFLAAGGSAVAAHAGGAITGFLFARAERSGVDLTSWARVFFERRKPRAPRRSKQSGRGGLFGRGASKEKEESLPRPPDRGKTLREKRAETNARRNKKQQEVDRILDKISENGYDALSEEEKKTLEDASRQQ